MTYLKLGILGETREKLIERLGEIQAIDHDFTEWLDGEIDKETEINDRKLALLEIKERWEK